MNDQRPDYFQPTTPAETALRQIKGNVRRAMVIAAIEQDGFDTIPDRWLAHDLSADLKNQLGMQQPNYRGGEDLPDLFEGEVEIARVSLVNSVHGEVTSLRARSNGDGTSILLRIVDEYCESSDYEFVLEQDRYSASLTAEGVLEVFSKSEPCACESSCELRFSSDFYPGLDELANKLGVKKVWED